jgi:hypothetical protein
MKPGGTPETPAGQGVLAPQTGRHRKESLPHRHFRAGVLESSRQRWQACFRVAPHRRIEHRAVARGVRTARSTELAKKEGRTQSWVQYRLRFGRFLNFITMVIKTDSLPKNLTERRFRSLWEQTDKAAATCEHLAVAFCLAALSVSLAFLTGLVVELPHGPPRRLEPQGRISGGRHA